MTFCKFSPFQLPLLSFVRRKLFWSALPKRRNVRSAGLPETLEVRCLLSAVMSATLVDGRLTITDTDAVGKNNLLTVSVVGTDLIISDANEQFIAAPAGGSLSNGDKTLTIPLSLVPERLTINGGGGEDAIEVNSLGAAFGTDLFINGNAGADTLTFQSGPIITSRNINVTVDTITVNTPLTVAAQMEWVATGDDTLLSINAPISIGGYSSFAADKMAINATIDVALGWLKLYPESTADTYDAIDIGAVGDSASNTLQLSQEELNRLTAESIFIGDYFTGPITISDSIEHDADSHFQIQTFLNVVFNSGTGWTTHNGDLRITGAGTAPGIHNFVGIDLNNATLSSSGTGIIALDGRGGSGGPSGSGNTGIHAHDGSVIESTGTGKIYLLGTGGGGTSDSRGVQIDDASVTSVTGDIQVLGQGGSGELGHGVWMLEGGAVESIGSAKIAIEGTGGNGSNAVGVLMYSGNGAKVSSVDGEISIIGHGGQSVAGSLNRGIVIASSALIQSTGTAPITLNGTGGSGSDSAEGVEFRDVGTRLTSAAGNIHIIGQGGHNTSAHGVWVATGSVIDSTGTASVTIQGTGGNASDSKGVYISGNGLGTRVSSVDGDISITGEGGTILSGDTVHGLVIASGALVQSTGLAKINLQGTSGDALHNTRGIEISNAGTQITSATGDIHITGQGGPAIEGHGVMISDGGIVTSTGTAQITIEGTGGTGNSDTRGVQVGGATTKITSVAGDIHITGHGRNGINHYNIGVWLLSGATVSSSGSAKIAIDGTGGTGISENNGVIFNGYGTAGPTNVTSVDGDITITGHGASSGTGSANRGIGMYTGAMIQSTGIAKITLDGTGGAGSDSSRGVELVSAGTRITSMSGDIQISGQGGANASAYGIWIVDGAAVESTVSANITLNGTGGDGTDGNAVAVNTGRVTSVDGDITIIGRGGISANGDGMRGVWLLDGSHVESTGNAKIVIDGTAGTGGNALRGTEISDGTVVRSAIGDIEITGHGGPNAIFAFGIWVRAGAVVESIGIAKVTLNGTGGDGVGGDVGVMLNGYGNGGDTRIKSLDGDIHIIGIGGNATNEFNWGIGMFEGAVVESTGLGKVTLEGTGGSGLQYNRGVEIADSGTKVSSIHGDVSITGQGGEGSYGFGVWLRHGAAVESTGNASVTIHGSGGNGGGEEVGVVLNGFNSPGNTRISSLDGDINVIGLGGDSATGTNNRGFGMFEGSVIESTGVAKILIDGTGGTAVEGARGVEIGDSGTRITSRLGDIQITGQGGANAYAFGVWLRAGAVVESTDTATITVTGTGGANGGEDSGVVLNGYGQFGATRIASLNGDIVITGRGGNAALNNINRGVGMFEGAVIESTGIARVLIDGTGGAGTDNSRGVEIGDSGTRISSKLGDIQITGQGAASVYGFGVWLRAEAVVESTDTAKVIVTGTGGSGGGNDTGVIFNGYGHSGTTRIVSANGDIVITGHGGNDAANSYNPGVGVYNGSVIQSTGTAKVIINGTGGYGAAYSRGVEFADADTRVTSAIGDIQITGQAGSGGPGNNGVAVYNGAAIESTGSSKVSVTGTGGTGTHSNFGILIKESNSWISSVNGDIQIVGSGGTGTSGFNAGVLLQAGGSVNSTGIGKIDITGTGGSGVFDGELQVGQAGVWLLDAGSAITSKDGDIRITGIGGGGGLGSAANHGVKFQGGAIQTTTGGSASVQVTGTPGSGPGSFGILVDNNAGFLVVDTSAGAGTITLIADTLEINGSLQPGSINAGAQMVSIHPETAGIEIDLGSQDNSTTLGLTDAELDRITAGTMNIGNSISGNLRVSADITRSAATNMQLITAGDLLISGGGVDTNSGLLLLDARPSPRAILPTHAGVDVNATSTKLAGDLSISLNGLAVDSGYSQLNVVGGIDLNGVHLQLTGSLIPTVGDTFVIVNNDAVDAFVGTFNDLAEGSIISFNGRRLQITYVGGSDSNDVVLTAVNNVPQLTLNGGPVTFSAKANKKGGPITVLPNVTVVEPDQSPAFGIGGGTLTVSIDISAKITKKGFKLHDTIGGFSNVSALGTTTGPAFGNGKLAMLIALHANTTAAAIETFLRGITFQTKGDGVKLPQRILQAQLTDAGGAASNLLQQTINVTKN